MEYVVVMDILLVVVRQRRRLRNLQRGWLRLASPAVAADSVGSQPENLVTSPKNMVPEREVQDHGIDDADSVHGEWLIDSRKKTWSRCGKAANSKRQG